MLSFESKSPAETRRLGERLARLLKPGDVVLLQGELGAGKTCFAQGIGKGLHVQEPVKSSSFVLVNEYHGRYLNWAWRKAPRTGCFWSNGRKWR